MDNFFVYLSSENIEDENISKAVACNRLPLQIDAVDKLWEVSLIKTAITFYWDNAINIYISATRTEADGTVNVIAFKLEDGLISGTDNLYNKINEGLTELLQPTDSPHNWFKFGLAGKGQSLHFKVGKNVKLEMSRELQLLLKLEKSAYDNTNNEEALVVRPAVTEKLEDVAPYQKNIFIACDNIEPVFVNKQMTGILGDVQVGPNVDWGDILTISKKLKTEILDYVVETIPCVTLMPRVMDNTPIEFRIPSRNGWFIDVNNIFHVLKIRVEKRTAAGNFAGVPNGDPMSPYCGLLWTVFKDLEVSMNHSLVWSSNQSYQTVAYINKLLNTPKDEKETIMTAALWYEDNPGAFNIIADALDDAVSSNQKLRAAVVDGGNLVTLKGKVFCDVLNLQTPLLDGVTIDLRFTPHTPEFCLTATANTRYRIVLLDSFVMCGRKQMKNTSIARMTYDYTHHKMLRFTHQKDLADFGPVVLAEGPNLPNKVIVGLQSESAFSGSYTKNRLAFYPSGVTNVTVLVNDVHKPHKLGYVMEYTGENPVLTNYTDSYVGLFQEMGFKIPTITQNQFKDGFTLFAFDISKGHSTEENEPNPTNQGNCSLKITFRKDMLQENVVIYSLLIYDKSFDLSNLKNDYRKIEFFESAAK